MSLVTVPAAGRSKACHGGWRRVGGAKKLQNGGGDAAAAATRLLSRVPAATAGCPGRSAAVTVTTPRRNDCISTVSTFPAPRLLRANQKGAVETVGR